MLDMIMHLKSEPGKFIPYFNIVYLMSSSFVILIHFEGYFWDVGIYESNSLSDLKYCPIKTEMIFVDLYIEYT